MGLAPPVDTEQFVVANLPRPGCRVLEVGCGSGDLARALVTRGFEVTAIDPDPGTPDSPPFHRVGLEDFSPPQPYDAVVAVRSLHHIHDLGEALKKIHDCMAPGGVLILDEFAWDRMDEATAGWYLSHATGERHEDASLRPPNFPDAWIAEHDHMHESQTMRSAVRRVFADLSYEDIPYLATHYLERPDLVPEEIRLIRSGEIRALGFRYVGTRS